MQPHGCLRQRRCTCGFRTVHTKARRRQPGEDMEPKINTACGFSLEGSTTPAFSSAGERKLHDVQRCDPQQRQPGPQRQSWSSLPRPLCEIVYTFLCPLELIHACSSSRADRAVGTGHMLWHRISQARQVLACPPRGGGGRSNSSQAWRCAGMVILGDLYQPSRCSCRVSGGSPARSPVTVSKSNGAGPSTSFTKVPSASTKVERGGMPA